jgi:hypothetical protein
LARLLITLGMRDAGGAAAVDARGSVPVSARTRRGAAWAATASPWGRGPAQAGWPDAPAGLRIVASDQDVGWVVWRTG